jgi:hypothetical protein
VVVFPAILANFSQFVTRVLCLPAVPTVVFNGFMQAMICFFGPVLAFRLVGANTRRAGKQQKTDQSRERHQQFPVLQHSQTPFIVHLGSPINFDSQLGLSQVNMDCRSRAQIPP